MKVMLKEVQIESFGFGGVDDGISNKIRMVLESFSYLDTARDVFWRLEL